MTTLSASPSVFPLRTDWSGELLVPTPDGLYHRMSVVAIRSADGASSWQYVGTVANASQYPPPAFGPDENVRHLTSLPEIRVASRSCFAF